MRDKALFITGRLAEKRLRTILHEMPTNFDYEIWNAGVAVAALITETIIVRRLPRPVGVSRVILPGRCRADINRLSNEFNVEFERGPDELKDLPLYFGSKRRPDDLSRHNIRLFAEIVDASLLSIDEVERCARKLSHAGADVIDLGCLPDVQFPHLEETVHRLRSSGFKVSVDSADLGELRRAASVGADYLLSLNEFTVEFAGQSRPILVPVKHGDLDSIVRGYNRAKSLGIEPILDPILDPIHFGLVDSILRYRNLRELLPDAELMMGTGNLTELTEVDTAGLTSILIGICSELRITNTLAVNVSAHTRRTLQEHDAARRLMYAAKQEQSVPKGFSTALLQIHDRNPYVNDQIDICTAALEVKDKNFRIEVAADGIHAYNRDGHWITTSAFDLFGKLQVSDDGTHAFYLGAELQKAEIAYQLGKRYVQDEPLDWGVATDSPDDGRLRLKSIYQNRQMKKPPSP